MALRGDEKYVALNRRARHDYLIEDTLEAGMQLTGTEVKVLRRGLASIAEAYASDEGGEIFLLNANFPEYPAARFNHEPRRNQARGHDRGPARDLFQRTRPRQDSARPRQGKAQGGQARGREAA